jgi:hypothetical protein
MDRVSFQHLRFALPVNSAVKLPLLVTHDSADPILPKGMNEENLDEFFISQQCFNRLNEMMGERDPSENGMVLSGPHGVGKSSTLVLLISVAWANSWFVVYIPKCGEWIKTTNDLCALYFLQRVWDLNQDLLPPSILAALQPFITLEPMSSPVGAYDAQCRLMQWFASQTDRPVLYAFDEHNELFVTSKDLGYAPIETTYFKPYRQWTG